jgi:serine/threonine-protein kinase
MRFDVDLGADAVASAGSTLALSRDGTRIVYAIRRADGQQQLATRLLEQSTVTMLPGTEGASEPFFSPDGRWVGFFGGGKLRKISVDGGASVPLCDVLTVRGASWGEDGMIVLSLQSTDDLSRVADTGGTPTRLTKRAAGEATHRWPQVLESNRGVLFTASPSAVSYEDASVQIVSTKSGSARKLVDGYFGRYLRVDATRGYLIFIREGTLFAVPFDTERLELLGSPVAMLADVGSGSGLGIGQFDFSNGGTFAYNAGSAADQSWPVVWLDSSGKTEALIATAGAYDVPRLAPDGKRLVVQMTSGRSRDLYLHDAERGTLSKLTFSGGASPVWAPDNKHLAYSSTRGSILWIRADGGSSEPYVLFERKGAGNLQPYSFSPDGRHLAYWETNPNTGNDISIATIDMTDPERPKWQDTTPFLHTPLNEIEPSFSPDGRWIAYRSNETGVMEMYVRPFRGTGKWLISSGGVMHPRWSPAGKQLFYETFDGHVMVADYSVSGDVFVPSKPRVWSPTTILAPSGAYNMDIAPDGRRVVAFQRRARPDEALASGRVTFLLNFLDELRRRVPLP